MTSEQWQTLSRIILGIHQDGWVTEESYQQLRTFLVDSDLAPDWIRRIERLSVTHPHCTLRQYRFDITRGLLCEFRIELDPSHGTGQTLHGVVGRSDGQVFELFEETARI